MPFPVKGEDVFMVGGANSAGQAAIHFSKYAKTVTLVVRGDSLNKSMSHYLIHQINETPNIHVLLNSKVTEVRGENRLEFITITNTQTGQLQTVPTSGLYIFIGAVPHTDVACWTNRARCKWFYFDWPRFDPKWA